MLDIDEMSTKEIHDLLRTAGHGHLGCVSEEHPYVVPMHYYLKDSEIYIFTTVGMKTQYIDAIHQFVCKWKQFTIESIGAASL